ncbi:hypothetical protein ACKKBF_B13270 [Auxenochlorella protothecoides x Auxenochlorella symbiontica]
MSTVTTTQSRSLGSHAALYGGRRQAMPGSASNAVEPGVRGPSPLSNSSTLNSWMFDAIGVGPDDFLGGSLQALPSIDGPGASTRQPDGQGSLQHRPGQSSLEEGLGRGSLFDDMFPSSVPSGLPYVDDYSLGVPDLSDLWMPGGVGGLGDDLGMGPSRHATPRPGSAAALEPAPARAPAPLQHRAGPASRSTPVPSGEDRAASAAGTPALESPNDAPAVQISPVELGGQPGDLALEVKEVRRVRLVVDDQQPPTKLARVQSPRVTPPRPVGVWSCAAPLLAASSEVSRLSIEEKAALEYVFGGMPHAWRR